LELASSGCACRSTSDSHRPSILRRCQRPTSNFSRSCILCSPCRSASDSRRTLLLRLHLRTNFQPFVVRCIFRLYLLANYRLSPAIDLPLLPLDPTARLHRPSHPPASPSNPNADFHRNSHSPVLPSNPTSDSSSELASSDFTFPSTANFRQPSTFQFCPPFDLRLSPASIFGLYLRTQLPTLIGPCILRLCQRPTFDLDRSLNSSGGAVDLLPTCVGS